ncbi:MAG: DUF4422 domain-containing protein [Prolixibacteraceae bacterium]|nr:DUF4422 domain-containing protein [Prolixibacteraceae bacterium]
MSGVSGTKILVFHYKNGQPYPALPCYVHIWAGKNKSAQVSSLIGDDTYLNISHKNKYYSELTGLYWFWKNQGADIVATCHYRRFFTAKQIPWHYRIQQWLYFPIGLKRKRKGLIYCQQNNFWTKRIINAAEIEQLMLEYDVILPQPRSFKYTLEEHFNRYHQKNDLVLLQEIIAETALPFLPAFNNMLKQKQLYANNMFIMRSSDFEQLATWLFSILETFEKRVNLGEYHDYQERIMGFLSERLITTWILHHQEYRIKTLPLIYMKHLKKG